MYSEKVLTKEEIKTYKSKGCNNWFETLHQALESEGLQDLWNGSPMSYGETARLHFEIEKSRKWFHIIMFRNTDGRYERPLVYSC